MVVNRLWDALASGLGITLAAATIILPAVVVSALGIIIGLIGIVSSAFTAVAAVGGIYSTATGPGTSYDKAESFAHDATMLVVSMIGIWGSVNAVKNSLAMYKSASQNLAGRKTRPTASEVVQNSKGPNLISSMDDFLDYTNGFLDEDALQYVKEVLNNDGDDVAKLKKIAQLVEDGSKKIGKKLSKEELKAGLDAFWDDAGVEGALAAIERVFQGGLNSIFKNGNVYVDDLRADPTVFSGKFMEEVAQALMDSGYNIAIKDSTQSTSGAKIIKITNPGNGKNIAQVQVSPGGGRHGEAPYVKFSTTDQGKIKVIDGYEKDYKTDGKEKAILIFAKQ